MIFRGAPAKGLDSARAKAVSPVGTSTGRRSAGAGLRAAAAAMAIVLAGGCGGGGGATKGPEDPEPEKEPLQTHESVEITLRTSEGALLFVGDLRGRPVLLFLFATFDGVSQAALQPLRRFIRAHPEVHVLGVAIQPDPQQLLDAYVHALSPPFPVAYDPEDRVEAGKTALGSIGSVPTFVMLDALGRPVERHEGFASQRTLENMLYRAQQAVPNAAAEAAGEQPPLLGNP